TNPFSSSSGLGLVTNVTSTVTTTQVTDAQSACHIAWASGWASGENANTLTQLGSNFIKRNTVMEVATPASSPQNPPMRLTPFESMPSTTVPNNGAMKKPNSACT